MPEHHNNQPPVLVVIGGGAAGFFCAVNAARLNRTLKVILLEKTSKMLSKVRISGGGRCNVTHALFDITEMSRRYPRGQNFVKKSFHQFFTTDTIEWFEKRGVTIKAEADGRMFPVTNSSQTIIDCLLREANTFGVEIRMNADVKALEKDNSGFKITMGNGQTIIAAKVCVAAGGYPKASMFDWLKALGHTINEPVPSLFTFNLPQHAITELMGVCVEHVKTRIEGTKLAEEGPLLITHWGLSGPAVLKLSAWGARDLASAFYVFKVHINWVPAQNEQQIKLEFRDARMHHASKKIINHNFLHLPARLWQFLLKQSGIDNESRFADLHSKNENLLIRNLSDFVVEVKGKTTYKEEFVTSGGIHLSEVDPNTMMSRKQEGLFFAGEILDVDGITGGFNFQHAWTSGMIAAKNMTAFL
ncbi:MAG: NAD(P)/FAD-dependent oxidoreductase [Flavisolibacter sp.]|jgi:predicted Rossmann fold flavoprotein|nr:NAD(P)/FAD-dependent oxidoreductase [Flavisolibacter sp.]